MGGYWSTVRAKVRQSRRVWGIVLYALLVLWLIVPFTSHTEISQAAFNQTSASTASFTSGTYHFVGSFVPGAGQQVSHVEGILVLQVGSNGSFSSSTLRLSTGETIAVTNDFWHRISFVLNGQTLDGVGTATGPNRMQWSFQHVKWQHHGILGGDADRRFADGQSLLLQRGRLPAALMRAQSIPGPWSCGVIRSVACWVGLRCPAATRCRLADRMSMAT